MGTPVSRKQCPKCMDTGQDNLIIYQDGSQHCFACGHGISSKNMGQVKSNLIKDVQNVPLTKRNITQDTASKFGVGLNKSGKPVLVFPFYKDGKLVAQKTQTLDKKIGWKGDAKNIDWFGSRVSGHKKKIFISEGEEDCLALYQTLGPTAGSFTSLTNGATSVGQFLKKYHQKRAKSLFFLFILFLLLSWIFSQFGYHWNCFCSVFSRIRIPVCMNLFL